MSALAADIDRPASKDGADRIPVLAPGEALRHEMNLLHGVVTGRNRFAVSVWTTHRCLVTRKSFARAPNFGEARDTMGARGWPVFLRSTGGGVTPQAPGVINVSTAFVMPPDQSRRIQEAYWWFCKPILDVLKRLGVAAHCAAVPGSFCDGTYNIVSAGKKLAGTAQRWRRMTAPPGAARHHAVLAHAAILCEADLPTMVRAVNDFYDLCGLDRPVRRDRHITLSELVPAETFGQGRGDFLRSTAIELEASFQKHFAAL